VVLSTDARPAAKSKAADVFGVIETTAEKVEAPAPCDLCTMLGDPCDEHKKREPMWPQ
jgi:hypothetical protein